MLTGCFTSLSLDCHMLFPISFPFIFGLWEMWANSYITNRKFWITNRSSHELTKSLPSDTSAPHHWDVGDEQPANPWVEKSTFLRLSRCRGCKIGPCVTICDRTLSVSVMWPFRITIWVLCSPKHSSLVFEYLINMGDNMLSANQRMLQAGVGNVWPKYCWPAAPLSPRQESQWWGKVGGCNSIVSGSQHVLHPWLKAVFALKLNI